MQHNYQCMITLSSRSHIILSFLICIMLNLSQLPTRVIVRFQEHILIYVHNDSVKVSVPTTEVFRPDITGSWISLQRFSSCSHAGMRSITSSGSVAIFTSERPLAHADELTNHIKVKIAVTTKSCRTTKHNYNSDFVSVFFFLHWNTHFNGLYNNKIIKYYAFTAILLCCDISPFKNNLSDIICKEKDIF